MAPKERKEILMSHAESSLDDAGVEEPAPYDVGSLIVRDRLLVAGDSVASLHKPLTTLGMVVETFRTVDIVLIGESKSGERSRYR